MTIGPNAKALLCKLVDAQQETHEGAGQHKM